MSENDVGNSSSLISLDQKGTKVLWEGNGLLFQRVRFRKDREHADLAFIQFIDGNETLGGVDEAPGGVCVGLSPDDEIEPIPETKAGSKEAKGQRVGEWIGVEPSDSI